MGWATVAPDIAPRARDDRFRQTVWFSAEEVLRLLRALGRGLGRDRLHGGPGKDRLFGGLGRDRLRGGPGNDRLHVRGDGRDIVRCGRGRDRVRADTRDRLRGCERIPR